MAAGGSIFAKLGGAMQAKPKATQSPKAATPGTKKGFDINIYFKAVGIFFNDFYGKKVPYFFKNTGAVMKKFSPWWGRLPQDEQISYGVLLLGHLMIIVGIVLIIVM
jgi:hypothetical protein